MQIYSHLPMFQVLFPAYAGAAITEILDISSFELIPLGELTTIVLSEPEDDGELALDMMAANGYESYYTILNLGSTTVLFILAIAIPLLLILIYKPFKSRSKYALENHNSLTNAIHGNILLRFIIETCLDISISVILQLYYSDLNDGLF